MEHDEIIEKRRILKGQLKPLMKSDLTVTCSCGKTVPVYCAYKCLYCGLWFCKQCAEEHFEPRNLKQLLYVVAAAPDRGPMKQEVFEVVDDIFDRTGLTVSELIQWNKATASAAD